MHRCEENEVTLECKPSLTAAVVESGYSPTYGARPLRRAVQRLCEDAVAEAILGGFVQPGEKLKLEAGDGEGQVVLVNAKGKKRVHEASAAQGIEDSPGIGESPGGDTVPTIDVVKKLNVKKLGARGGRSKATAR